MFLVFGHFDSSRGMSCCMNRHECTHGVLINFQNSIGSASLGPMGS